MHFDTLHIIKKHNYHFNKYSTLLVLIWFEFQGFHFLFQENAINAQKQENASEQDVFQIQSNFTCKCLFQKLDAHTFNKYLI